MRRWTGGPRPARLLEDDGEDRDHHREDAEALGERRPEDELGADRRGSIGIAPDRLGGETRQDADADAGADDPEGRETGSDVFHESNLPPSGSGTSARTRDVAWLGAARDELSVQCSVCRTRAGFGHRRTDA